MSVSTSEERLERWTGFLRRRVARLKEISSRPAVRVVLFVIMVPLFGAALVLAWRRADISLASLDFLPMLGVVAAVPVGVLVSTWQVREIARIGGVGVRWWRALRVVTLSSLSTLLPMSSGTVVRGGAVVVWGVPVRTAGIVMMLDGMIWACVAFLFSSVAAFTSGAPDLGVGLLTGGLLVLPMAMLLARLPPGRRGRGELVLARFTGILVQVGRLYACFHALGYGIRIAEASTLIAAGPLASLFFFLPGGLGVEEGFISAVAATMGLSAAGAFLAAALNRLIGLSVLLLWEAALLVRPAHTRDVEAP